MKSAIELRQALQELLPEALHHLPPEEAPRGTEGAIRVHRPRAYLEASDLVPPQAEAGPEDLEEGADFKDLEEMFEFGPMESEAVPALGPGDIERIRQAVLVKGVDALGWYVPFHVIGLQWGIYITTKSLAYVADQVFGGVAPDVPTRVKLAFRAIHQHELFHFACEYAVTQLELLLAEPIHVHRAKHRDAALGYVVAEEQAANAWMLRSLWSARRALRTAGRAKALRTFIAGQPVGYRDAPEIVETQRFTRAIHELAVGYLTSDPRGAYQVNVDWLYPIRPRIDWRECPVHLIHDGARLPFAPGAFDLFAQVSRVKLTEAFQRDLEALPERFRRAWAKVERMLAVSTASGGLDFKLWQRQPNGRVFSVRVSQSYRAHLRYDERGQWFAEGIGTHAAMGHG